MMKIAAVVKKLRSTLREQGLMATLGKCVDVINWKVRRRRLLKLQSPEQRFTWIYRKNYWSTKSASGAGSTLEYTRNLRAQLPGLLRKYSIRQIFDAPCGDFLWMREVLSEVQVGYTGGDIVQPLIESLSSQYGNSGVRFMHADITRTPFPAADLMICRDCLFHLSYVDIRLAVQNFLQSGIPYLLTTTHVNTGQFVNRNITTGDFRMIDLFSSPFHFPADPLEKIEDWIPPSPPRLMCLWTREQIAASLQVWPAADLPAPSVAGIMQVQ